jgi:hypothetical protein
MKVKVPMILKRINFPYEMLQQIAEVQEAGHIESENETVRQLVKIGIFVQTMKSKVNDKEFMEQMKKTIKDEKMFDWLETLTPDQLSGLKTATEIVLDGKYKQKQLI